MKLNIKQIIHAAISEMFEYYKHTGFMPKSIGELNELIANLDDSDVFKDTHRLDIIDQYCKVKNLNQESYTWSWILPFTDTPYLRDAIDELERKMIL